MSFDKKLQSLRKTAGLSQEELASELGVSRQAVSKWESGTSYPEMDKLILMTRLFKCSLDDLVNDEVRDSSIVKNKVSKGQTYIDSLLEFITKSINMFTSMKMASVLKVFIEMLALILIMACISAVIYSIGITIFNELFINDYVYYPIYWLLSRALFIVIVAINLIIIFQFYKIRYLDYYDKLVYKYEVENNSNKEKTNDLEESDKKEEKLDMKKKERIIIRDPEHRPLAFLSFISSMIIVVFKAILRLTTIPFLLLLIFLVIACVVLIYLITYNVLFVGIMIACVAAISLTIIVIRILNQDLFKKACPVRLLFWLVIVSLFVGSIGVGFSIISLKNIEVKNISNIKNVKKEYAFSDKLYLNLFNAIDGESLTFVVDESVSNVVIDVEYESNNLDFEFDNPGGNKNYLLVTKVYKEQYNTKEYIDEFLKNLKKNIITDYSYYEYYSDMTVRANEKNIRKLINTISEYNDIYTKIVKRNGYTYYYVDEMPTESGSKTVCAMDDYYRKCVYVTDNTYKYDFKYEYKDNKLIYDEKKFECYIRNHGYVCQNRYEDERE